MSGCCLPSAPVEGWHSPKRPSSTVVIQQFVNFYAEESTYFCIIHPARRNSLFRLLLCPSGTRQYPQSFVVDVHSPYIIAGTRHGSSLAMFLLVTHLLTPRHSNRLISLCQVVRRREKPQNGEHTQTILRTSTEERASKIQSHFISLSVIQQDP